MISTDLLSEVMKNIRIQLGHDNKKSCPGTGQEHEWELHGKPLTGRTYYSCIWCGKTKRRGNDLIPGEYKNDRRN